MCVLKYVVPEYLYGGHSSADCLAELHTCPALCELKRPEVGGGEGRREGRGGGKGGIEHASTHNAHYNQTGIYTATHMPYMFIITKRHVVLCNSPGPLTLTTTTTTL